MTYEALLRLIIETDKERWLVDDQRGLFTCKDDLDVTLRIVSSDEREQFHEPWAEKFPDPVAYKQIVELWYGASFVKDYILVSVDGGRALLPLPRRHDSNTISVEQRAVADIVNSSGDTSDYLEYIGRFRIE